MQLQKVLFIAILGLGITLAGCNAPTTSSSTTSTTTSTNSSTTSSVSTSSITSEEFTLAELAEFDGANGSTAYVAVNGVVYDVTNAEGWTNGKHSGQQLAGTDATEAFAGSPHTAEILAVLPIVGTLVS